MPIGSLIKISKLISWRLELNLTQNIFIKILIVIYYKHVNFKLVYMSHMGELNLIYSLHQTMYQFTSCQLEIMEILPFFMR